MHLATCEPRCAAPCNISDRHAGALPSVENVLTRHGMTARWHPVLHRPFAATFDAKHTGSRRVPAVYVACSPCAGIEASSSAGDAGSSVSQHAETPSTSGHVPPPAVETRPGKLTRCVFTYDNMHFCWLTRSSSSPGHGHGPAKRLNFMYCARMGCLAVARPSKVLWCYHQGMPPHTTPPQPADA